MIHVALFGIEAGLAVVLTYFVHSAAWMLGALLLARLQRALSPAGRHVLWRAALLGPLVSSALALGLGHRWQWSPTAGSPVVEAPAAREVEAPRSPLLPGAVDSPPGFAGQVAAFDAGRSAPLPGSALVAAAWALVALAHLMLLARVAFRQRRALARRTPVDHGACLQTLERLARRARLREPIRSSYCRAAHTPLVLSAREICLPERALALDSVALEAMLAHEIAHVERRDAAWSYAALALQAVFWFQPLQRRARVELQESAELAADDRAVELTGDAFALAQALTEVAGWVQGTAPAASPAMARAGSPIVERVARLVEASDALAGARCAARTPWFALAVLVAIGACSPSVGAPEAQPPRVDAEPPAAPAVGSSLPASVQPRAPRESVAGAMPNPAQFSQEMTKLVLAEQRLREQLRSMEEAALAAHGLELACTDLDQVCPELERIRSELSETTARREVLQRDFEAGMQGWSKDFRQRFERDFGPRLEAWGRDFGTRMPSMSNSPPQP
jgi:beta-lactamase regulating signal transducer with metallopeptidase domain